MAKGLAALGALKAREQAAQRDLQSQQLGIQQSRFDFERQQASREAVIGQLDQIVSTTGQAIEGAMTKAAAIEDPAQRQAAMDNIKQIIESSKRQGQMLVEAAGVADPGILPRAQTFASRMDALSLTPSPIESGAVAAKQAGQQAAATETAQTEAELMSAGLEPGSPEAMDLRRRQLEPAAPAETNIFNIEAKAEEAGAVEAAKLSSRRDARILDEVDAQASQGMRQNQVLSFLERQMENVGQGKFAPVRVFLGQVMESAGLNPELLGTSIEEIASAESFGSVVNDLVLQKSEMMSGTLSEGDMKFLQATTPRLSNTAAGNALLLQYMMQMNDRAIMRQQMAETWLEEKGSMSGFSREWQSYISENPLFPPQDSEEVQAALSSPLPVIDEESEPVYQIVNGTLKRVR